MRHSKPAMLRTGVEDWRCCKTGLDGRKDSSLSIRVRACGGLRRKSWSGRELDVGTSNGLRKHTPPAREWLRSRTARDASEQGNKVGRKRGRSPDKAEKNGKPPVQVDNRAGGGDKGKKGNGRGCHKLASVTLVCWRCCRLALALKCQGRFPQQRSAVHSEAQIQLNLAST